MPRARLTIALSLLLAAAVASAVPSAARARRASRADDRVGNVDFPTSCTPQAQPALDKGLALLHSFQYSESEQSFAAAAQSDPQCAMAYWGQAMSHYELLWDFPDEKQLAEARKNIDLAQKAAKKSPRESEYIAAAAGFFNSDSKLSHADRTKIYVDAMGKLHDDNPGDVEAGALYAVALVSLADYNVDELANRRKAIAILNPLFAAHPNNPGVAHYLIHAADVPELAAQGLPAARAYAKIAPGSAHAIHMPSHIFWRLGLWQELIDSNNAAVLCASAATKAGRGEAHYQLHPMDFLSYGYLQSGQESKARHLVDELKDVPGAKPEDIAEHESVFEARNAVELHRWKEAAALPVHDEKLIALDVTYWARALGSARTGDVAGARQAADKLAEVTQAQIEHDKKLGNPIKPGKTVMQQEADAWIALANGQTDAALAGLRAADERERAQREDPYAAPAGEMLADMLLELKRPQEALDEYQKVLKDYPNRFDAVLGAAQAADGASHHDLAQVFYSQLRNISAPGADRPELQVGRNVSNGH